MAASVLIRENGGKIVGYALLQGRQLYIRIHGSGETARVNISAGDVERLCDVRCDAQEHVFEWQGGAVERVHIMHRGGQDESEGDTTSAGGRIEPKKEKEAKKTEECCKKGDARSVYIKREDKTEAAVYPQTRWPPPPCWPSARYADGVWREGGD